MVLNGTWSGECGAVGGQHATTIRIVYHSGFNASCALSNTSDYYDGVCINQ